MRSIMQISWLLDYIRSNSTNHNYSQATAFNNSCHLFVRKVLTSQKKTPFPSSNLCSSIFSIKTLEIASQSVRKDKTLTYMYGVPQESVLGPYCGYLFFPRFRKTMTSCFLELRIILDSLCADYSRRGVAFHHIQFRKIFKATYLPVIRPYCIIF